MSLTTQLQSGSAIEMIDDTEYTDDDGKKYTLCYAALRLRINNRDYMLPFDRDVYNDTESTLKTVYGKVYRESHCIRVIVELDLQAEYSGYCLYRYLRSYDTSSGRREYTSYKRVTNPNLGTLISDQGQYAWSIRLYSKGTINGANNGINQIGYGGLDLIDTITDTTGSEDEYVKIIGTPHTCIYDYVIGKEHSYILASGNDIQDNFRTTINNILKYIDNNAKYYFKINNRQYPIAYYRLYDAGNKIEDGNFDNYTDSTEISKYFDSYGNPIHGYIYIKNADIKTDIDSKRVSASDTYSITSNYIDSRYAYFDVEKEPVITITENTGKSLDDTSFEAPFVLTYCNLALNIEFEQSEGIFSNYHNFQVYKYNEKYQRFDLKYSSANKYNQQLICEYDKFFSDALYMIKINITDTAQRIHTREVYLKTEYGGAALPQYAVAEYYEAHNSIIIDWSKITSITPKVTGFYEYVKISNGEIASGISYNAVHLKTETVLNYYHDDFGEPLRFEHAALALKFKGLDATTGNIVKLICSDGFSVNIKYTNTAIVVTTSEKEYIFKLYDNYSVNQVQAALSKPEANMSIPYIYDDITKDMIWLDDYYFHTEDKISEGEWLLVISRDGCRLKQIFSDGTEIEHSCTEQALGQNLFGCPRLVLFGDIIFEKIAVVNNAVSSTVDKLFSDNWNWDNNTVILNDFNYTLNGTGYSDNLNGIAGFHVYKTLGTTDDTLYETGVIEGTKCLCLEDFACGDNCEYTYYIYPLVQKTDNPDLYYVASPIKTEPIKLNSGAVSVFGLKPIDDEKRTFIADLDTVWVFRFNLQDSGWNINNDKTFYDTVAKYNQESVGNRSYITKNISALLGCVNCRTSGDYDEDYDILTTWMDFVRTPQLKCLTDLRGLILPGNFEAGVSGEYLDVPGSLCTTSFTWRQKSDLDIISIHGTPLPFNPLHNSYLYSSDEYSLMSGDNYLLYGSMNNKEGTS
ncbi:MAG: hypothetical protein Q4G33_10130 [bacterium]|nr:hypothetical protein [bacterium]